MTPNKCSSTQVCASWCELTTRWRVLRVMAETHPVLVPHQTVLSPSEDSNRSIAAVWGSETSRGTTALVSQNLNGRRER
jgi:hypothetical protein